MLRRAEEWDYLAKRDLRAHYLDGLFCGLVLGLVLGAIVTSALWYRGANVNDGKGRGARCIPSQ